jgi:hypothetical protein
MRRLAEIEARMLESPDQQVSLTDPDARSMVTSGRGSGVVGYNVQVAVETEHHLIVAHEVTNVGSDRAQLATMVKEAKAALRAERLEAVADRGFFNGEEILACEQAGITVTLPKPMTSGAKAAGRFGKQDFVYQPEEDVYRCPAGETPEVPLYESSMRKPCALLTHCSVYRLMGDSLISAGKRQPWMAYSVCALTCMRPAGNPAAFQSHRMSA